MMKKKTIIRDTVHTYIEIEENVRKIIDTNSFQRLKNIKQLTIQHLYPSANHTRFEHSLGVMHLALKVFNKIKDKLLLDADSMVLNDAYLKDHLLYASLLHDIGHAPFSHVGEKFYDKKSIIHEIKREVSNRKFNIHIDFLCESKIANHELMSCYIIIRKLIDKLLFCNYDPPKGSDIKINLEYIFRIICGVKYEQDDETDARKRHIMNTIITIVNSETIDVDKIDYILRDNKVVGYIGPRLDIDRIIMSITVHEDFDGLMFTHMGISALQGLIDCRDVLYLWVFNHHTVVYTDYLYQRCFLLFDKLHKTSKNNNEWASLKSFFSCQAIADNCVSDVDALTMINKAFRLIKHEPSTAKYSNSRLIEQLMNRNYLKPLWKTINEFNDFLIKIVGMKDDEHNRLIDYINNWRNRMKLVKSISTELKIPYGNLFIIKRENKFCETILDTFKILINNKPKALKEVLPTKNYEEMYKKIAFYVYCEDKNKKHVRALLITKLKESIDDDQQKELGYELYFGEN
jgi:HD superfamily phosphohydrolase